MLFRSETVLFLATSFLLLVVAFGKNDATVFKLNKSIANLLTSPSTDQRFARGVRDVSDVAGLWSWMQHDFLSLFFAGSDVRVGNSDVIGAINVRQHRVASRSCNAPAALLEHLPVLCRSSFSHKHRETRDFGSGNVTWTYFREAGVATSRVSGRHGAYSGDGYLVVLDRNR